ALAVAAVVSGGRRALATGTGLPDPAGAEEINANQKDLNEFCQSAGNDGGLAGCTSIDANLTWTWDDTGWTGSNTGDACALYDTDGDHKANFALCATVQNNPAVKTSQTFYACDNSKMLNCGGSTGPGNKTSSCVVANVGPVQQDANKNAIVCNGSNCSTSDKQAQCCVK